MSTSVAFARPATEPRLDPVDLQDAPSTRRLGPLEIITSRTQRRARPRIVYALVATAALFVLLLTQLGISIAMSNGAYEVSALQAKQSALSLQQQKYHEKLGTLSSPQNIADSAAALGMVRNQEPVYLDLSTGTVYGTPTAAAGGTAPSTNLVPNSLLAGVPVVSKSTSTATSAADAGSAASSTATGAAASKSTGSSVASAANQLAAPETR